jgi:hypothetical protein
LKKGVKQKSMSGESLDVDSSRREEEKVDEYGKSPWSVCENEWKLGGGEG